MAFQSYSDIAKAQRKSKGRTPTSAKSLLSITQKIYDKKDDKRSVLTMRVSVQAMDNARFKVGDKVDIAYDPDRALWQVALQHEKTGGYAISGAKDGAVGTIRLTLYEGMKGIYKDDAACSVRIFSDDESVNCSAGRIIFAVKEDSIIVRD